MWGCTHAPFSQEFQGYPLVKLPEMVTAVELKIPTLVPYELFHAAYNQGELPFNQCCYGDAGPEGALDYWREALTEKWAQNHPSIAKHDVADMFPIVWHMDGGEIQKNSEFYELQVGSVLAQYYGADSFDGRFLVCMPSIEPIMIGLIHV